MKLKKSLIYSFFSEHTELFYEKGQIIIHGHDTPAGIYYLKKGYVKMSVIYEDGREITLNIFKPGSFFPIIWTFTGTINPYYYTTITPAVVYKAPREKLINLIKKDPEMLFEFSRNTIMRFRDLLINIEYLLSGDSYHRVVSALLLATQRYGIKIENKEIAIRIPLTHQEIADLSGITRETVTLAIKKLQKKGIVSYKKRILLIDDLSLLQKESNVMGD